MTTIESDVKQCSAGRRGELGYRFFLVGEQIAKTILARHNQAVMPGGRNPSTWEAYLLGLLVLTQKVHFSCIFLRDDTCANQQLRWHD